MYLNLVAAFAVFAVISGLVAWRNGMRYLRDRDDETPKTPDEIWYGSVRGPYLIIVGLFVGALLVAGLAEIVCLLTFAVMMFPESLLWNRDEYTRPITLDCRK